MNRWQGRVRCYPHRNITALGRVWGVKRTTASRISDGPSLEFQIGYSKECLILNSSLEQAQFYNLLILTGIKTPCAY
jgi:hypothetical protein